MGNACSFNRIHQAWQIAATGAIYSINAMQSRVRRPVSRLLTLKPPARIYIHLWFEVCHRGLRLLMGFPG